MVEYHVSVAPGGVADIFDQLESNKSTLRIKHFSVSQTTLDEVRKDRQQVYRKIKRGGQCWVVLGLTGKKGAIVEDTTGIQS